MQIIGQPSELNCRVEQDKALAAFPPGRLDQHVMTKLGDIDGYQNSGRLRTLNVGHGWLSPQGERSGTISLRNRRPCPGRLPLSFLIHMPGEPLLWPSAAVVKAQDELATLGLDDGHRRPKPSSYPGIWIRNDKPDHGKSAHSSGQLPASRGATVRR